MLSIAFAHVVSFPVCFVAHTITDVDYKHIIVCPNSNRHQCSTQNQSQTVVAIFVLAFLEVGDRFVPINDGFHVQIAGNGGFLGFGRRQHAMLQVGFVMFKVVEP
jgi:hypothetical protein